MLKDHFTSGNGIYIPDVENYLNIKDNQYCTLTGDKKGSFKEKVSNEIIKWNKSNGSTSSTTK